MQKKRVIAVPIHARAVLTPDNLALIDAVARTGSMAAAARELGLVPSALTYRVRQVEDALDVLLFDRSARQARITPAGAELLRSGEHLLRELDAIAFGEPLDPEFESAVHEIRQVTREALSVLVNDRSREHYRRNLR